MNTKASSPLNLKNKYPKAKYAPRPGCRYCSGTGEVNGQHGAKPCVCLFVRHDLVDMALKVLPQAMIDAMGIDVSAFQDKP